MSWWPFGGGAVWSSLGDLPCTHPLDCAGKTPNRVVLRPDGGLECPHHEADVWDKRWDERRREVACRALFSVLHDFERDGWPSVPNSARSGLGGTRRTKGGGQAA